MERILFHRRRMKPHLRLLPIAVAITVHSQNSFAQTGYPNSAIPTTVICQTDLYVSKEQKTGLPYTITIAPDMPSTSSNTNHHAANYLITGQIDYLYAITLPKFCPAKTDNSSLKADNFTSYPPNNGILNDRGMQQLSIGATIKVDPGQITPPASCQLHVMVNYN